MADKSGSGRTVESVWKTYEKVQPTDVLQQGDLIKSAGAAPHFSVVVTADCDLERRKHSRVVTLVPLLTFEQVICRSLAFDYFEAQDGGLRGKAKGALALEPGPNDPDFVGALKAHLRGGTCGSPQNELLAKVVAQEQIELAIGDVREIARVLNHPWAGRLDAFRKQIESRGDMLVLAPPPLINSSNQVAWLRGLFQEQVSEIALLTSREAECRWLRIAQLTSPFRYRLTQMLGQVFSDIGLPDLSSTHLDPDVQHLSGLQ